MLTTLLFFEEIKVIIYFIWLHGLIVPHRMRHKQIPIRLTADVSAETLQARREWQDIFKVMKGKKLQPRLLYRARISFRFDREIKTFTDKQKLREFSTTKPALQ